MAHSLRIRTAVEWTVFWFFAAAAASLPLATVDLPSSGAPTCGGWPTDPAWAAWEYRDVLWFSLAVFLPVSAGLTALLAWKTLVPVRTCATVGVVIGFVLVLTNVAQSMATAICHWEIRLN